MKVLLDENIDVRFKNEFTQTEHEILTVRDMGWSGLKNGELMLRIAEHGFHAFIAVDKSIPYQQNTASLSFSVIILDVKKNSLVEIVPYVPHILKCLNSPQQDKLIVLKL